MRFTTVLAMTALALLGGAPLGAQRLSPSGVSVAVGALHREDYGFAASLTGSYVISNRVISISVTPVDLGVLPPDDRYTSSSLLSGSEQCRDGVNGSVVDSIRCQVALRYGASVQLLGILADSANTLGFGVGYRVFDAPGPFAAATVDLKAVRDARLQLRARAGAKFYDFALGATFPLDRPTTHPTLIRSVKPVH